LQAEEGTRARSVTGVQTCALPIFTGVRVSSGGFHAAYGRGRPVDIYGNYYSSRIYIYCGGGYYHVHPTYIATGGRSSAPAGPPRSEERRVGKNRRSGSCPRA